MAGTRPTSLLGFLVLKRFVPVSYSADANEANLSVFLSVNWPGMAHECPEASGSRSALDRRKSGSCMSFPVPVCSSGTRS